MTSNSNREQGFGLIELMVAATILTILLAIVGNYLVSAGRAVAQSTAHQNDNAAAQRALSLIDTNVRFGCNASIVGGTLYVANTGGSCNNPGQPPCAEWYLSGNSLIEESSSGSATVASGVTGLAFTGNAAYNGLVTVQFNLRQPHDQSSDPGGVTVNETVTALNMPQPVSIGSALSGCP
jgi:prepilin-type N-terminal cleavage/methylation domain-containing protein